MKSILSKTSEKEILGLKSNGPLVNLSLNHAGVGGGYLSSDNKHHQNNSVTFSSLPIHYINSNTFRNQMATGTIID
jgi:hypothetical protein